MKLTSEQVKKVAKLTNLPLSESEKEKNSEQLSKILEYIKQLNKVDTSNIEPTYNVSGLENVLSEDTISPSLTQDEALSNASKKGNGYFVTKGVFDSG